MTRLYPRTARRAAITTLGCKINTYESALIAQKFRQDELDHKDMAYEHGATKKGVYSILDKVIKTSSRIAITISEKI